MYMYVHVCTCMYMYVHVCTCMYMYVCMTSDLLLKHLCSEYGHDYGLRSCPLSGTKEYVKVNKIHLLAQH